MSVLPSATEKTQEMEMGLELQERTAPLCWPHLNGTTQHNIHPPHHSLPPMGTAHHNLPPIAAITSCRPSSSPVLKTPKDSSNTPLQAPPATPSPLASFPKQNALNEETPYPNPNASPSSPRERKEEHVFTQPNPPRPVQTPVARPLTPFPDNPQPTTPVFQNAATPQNRIEPQASPPPPTPPPPNPNHLSINESNSPLQTTETNGSLSTPENTPDRTLPENGSLVTLEVSARIPDNKPLTEEPPVQQSTVLLPFIQNDNFEPRKTLTPENNPVNLNPVNHLTVLSPVQAASEVRSVSNYQQPQSKPVNVSPAVVEDVRNSPGVEHSTTGYNNNTAIGTVTSSTPSELVAPAAIPNYTQSNAHHNPQTHQQPEIRNYSNQSHRYFATSPAETVRPYLPSSPRNPVFTSPAINQSDSPSVHTPRVSSSHPNIPETGEYLPKLLSPSERKPVQGSVPYIDNHRRFMCPTGKTQLNPSASEVSTHGERFNPQASFSNQYRGTLPHIHNPERNSNHQDLVDGRNYPSTNIRIPTRQDANHSIQSDRGAGYYPTGHRPEIMNAQPQNDRRPAYPSGTSSNETIHSFSHQNSRAGYPPPSSAARNYAPQLDRAVLCSAGSPTAQPLENLRNFLPPHHDKNTAQVLNARPPQAQNYGANINMEPDQPRNDRPTHIEPLHSYPSQGSAPPSSRPYGPHERAYPSHHGLQEKPFHHSERNLPNYPVNNMSQHSQSASQYAPTLAHNLHAPQQPGRNNKYQSARINYPSSNSVGQQSPKKPVPEPAPFPNQPPSRYGFQAYSNRPPASLPPPSAQTPSAYSSNLRPSQDSHYYQSDPGRQPWGTSTGSSRPHEVMKTFMPRPATHRVEPEKHVYHPAMPHGATPIPRNDNGYQHGGHSPIIPTSSSSRERPPDNANALPRINPPSVVNVSSSRSPRFSSHPSQRPHPYPHPPPSTNPPHSGATQSYSGMVSTSVSSSFAPSLPRVNFPSPAVSSFNSVQPSTSSPSGYSRSSGSSSPMVHSRAPGPPHIDSRHLQPRDQMKPQGSNRPAFPYSPQQGSRPIPPSFNSAPRQPTMDAAMYRQNSSQYTPTRGHGMETDNCRNPFELPTPTNQSRTLTSGGVIKSHYSVPPAGYGQKAADTKSPAVGGVPPRSPYDNYPVNNYQSRSDSAMKQCDNSSQAMLMSYSALPARTELRPPGGNDDRQKPPQLSARFPPVPQSNYDLQKRIFDRMTGVQQAPPKLMEERPAAVRPKRESPLDLSVKTVRQSADSTRDDVDLYSIRNSSSDSRVPGAPKIDFNPNFAGPLVQPESRGTVTLPPVQSIRKFSQPPPDNMPAIHRKRPMDESQSEPDAKISKVDAWELAIDEQIEQKLKAARQSRQPTAPLTPLHPPAQSVTPTNPEILQPSARPPYDGQQIRHDRYRIPESSRTGHRGWNPGSCLPHAPGGPDPETIVHQISQGMMPDSRLLQDNSVIDMLRTSLERKEARLNALQAATRRQPHGQSFDQFSAERMFAPPSYPHGHHRGAEPVPIDIEPTKNYLRSPGGDGEYDGLAAFLAARIRTKAEMKQMGPASDPFRQPDIHAARSMILGASPPKLNRENRGQHQRRVIMSPGSEEGGLMQMMARGDAAGLRSSSETSVFDFRESDSESEMPMLERQTLDGMRRPRKTLPHTNSEAQPQQPPQPGPAPKSTLQPEPDAAWEDACDMFLDQLQKRPIKRSVRKKRPNPKFYANELEAPSFLKVLPEEPEIKQEPVALVVNETKIEAEPKISEEETNKTDEPDDSDTNIPPLPLVLKEESSSGDEGLIGVTVVKEGRVKLVTKKQRVVASDSEWGNSETESSSLDSEVSSEDLESDEDSEDSTAKKMRRRNRGDSSSSEDNIPPRRKGRRTRSRAVSGSDDDSDANVAQTKTRRSRNVVKSESEDSEQSDGKTKGRRTRAHALSDSGDSDTKKKNRRTRTQAESETEDSSEPDRKKRGVKTRQKSKKLPHPPARMRLRSKKRGATKKNAAFRPGWEEDLIKFKQQLRMPDRLINVTKPKKRLRAVPEDVEKQADEKDEKSVEKSVKKVKKESKDTSEKGDDAVKVKSKKKKKKMKKKKRIEIGDGDKMENETKPSSPTSVVSKRRLVTRGKDGILRKRSLRGSVGVRRSNKAVQNSKRHLNKGKKRLKLRRKFRSGFDYMRRKKKQVARKETEQAPTPVESKDPKRKERTEALDVSAEIKSWVVNKSAGETVLHRAARLGYADAALYCLETLRLTPSPRDHAGYTPLHEACSRGHVIVANYLLRFGANVSESARGGVRPLHQAAENNHMELVRLLLAYGADPLLATYTGQTAISLTSNDQLRELIQQHLADVQGEDAPKWPFDGPSSVFDPSWAVNPLADPPSPDTIPLEIEMEVSKTMLPALYRLLPTDGEHCDPSERWLLLEDLMNSLQVKNADDILASLPNTSKCEITDSDFLTQAVCCNILSAPSPLGPKVQLIRYDDAVRHLLDVEVLSVTLTDQ